MTLSIEDLVPAHPHARFDLLVEPWIPVLTSSQDYQTVGLGEVFEQGHEIQALALENPLEEFALTRFLLACGLFMMGRHRDAPWSDVVRHGQPLPAEPVRELLERLRPHSHLFHPTHPFLQNPELRSWKKNKLTDKDDMSKAVDPFASLLPHLPSKANEAWWYKPDGTLAAPDEAAVARALLVRHYAAVPGNEAETPLGKRCPGGVMVPGQRDTTQVYWRESTLAATIVANQMRADVSRVADIPNPTFFWEDARNPVFHMNDRLYLSTASGAASFVVDAPGFPVLRTVSPSGTKEAVVELVEQARLTDHLALRAPKKKDVAVVGLIDTTTIVLPPAATQFERAFALYRRATDVTELQPTVLNRQLLECRPTVHADLQTGTLTTSGPATGVRVDGFTAKLIAPAPLLLEGAQARALATWLTRAAGSKESVQSQLRFRVRSAVAASGKPDAAARACAVADLELWNRLESSLHSIFDAVATSPNPSTEMDSETAREWLDAAVQAFDIATSPYGFSPRVRAQILQQRNQLGGRLWAMLAP